MTPPALIVLNPMARHGSAGRRFSRVRPLLEERFRTKLVETDPGQAWRAAVKTALEEGIRIFIAAGGDGTVGAVASALVAERRSVPLGEVHLGAVGLGSSNDFHKPVQTRYGGVPLRLSMGTAAPQDLPRVLYTDETSVQREAIFVVSASLGATAAANAFFNRGDALLRGLKRGWVGGAILYAALRTIARHRNLRARLRFPAEERETALSNLSILKTPYLSGSFSYDTPIDPAGGRVAVNLCEAMGRWGLVRALAGLARGRFLGRPGTRHWMAESLEVELDAASDLELDGEVVRARRLRIDVLPERIWVCGR
jgi:diacylglycerol kinase family enzyme